MSRCLQRIVVLASAVISSVLPQARAGSPFGAGDARAFLEAHCAACHEGEAASAGLRLETLEGIESFRTQPDVWTTIAIRVSDNEMPPRGATQPALDERMRFVDWVEETWRSQACSAGLAPATNPVRRLNRDEYSATVRDLFDIQIDLKEMFPADGPGGEGFDNAVETLFVSPLLAEKYLEAAAFVVDAASKEFKSREKIFVARPRAGVAERAAARQILARFLPSAFRRPVHDRTVESYARLFHRARRRGLDFEPAMFFALRSALVSPSFLFHVRSHGTDAELRQYALASKLSYFLWGSMPDELLFDIAEAGRMDDPAVLERLVPRMLRDPRALEFFTRFTEQWLRTRELEGGHGPDAKLFPEYAGDAELRGDIRLQPVFFFREVLRENWSLLDFLDSGGTVLTLPLIKHLGLPMEKKQDSKNPNWMDLPESSGRGGLLGMPAIAALTSHPHRTSPVLRGVWILDSILGTPPPPPPPDVPELEESVPGEPAKSVREILASHSRDRACSSCHERIDPLGFALENYDVLGRWRDQQAGAPLDASGRLPDGTRFSGPQELKQVLLERKNFFLRNLAKRMLGYALGRGLTPADACAVESIVENVESDNFEAWSLVRQIVRSAPFLEIRLKPSEHRDAGNELEP